MMVSKRVTDYIQTLTSYNSDYCELIREQAICDGVPIIRRESECLLKTLLEISKPKTILEVGTAVGYSAIVMGEYATESYITTIENYDKRIIIAKKNIEQSSCAERIELIEGDATQVLDDLLESGHRYDFIFMDAAKAQYIRWLPDIICLLEKGGIIFSDNVLQDGDIAESRFAIDRRDRSIHHRLREYLYSITHHEMLKSSIVSVGDGVAISVLK